ncbi:MAG: ParB/RepB/Spo0J family partition protein [Acidobacteriaceae bacterium]
MVVATGQAEHYLVIDGHQRIRALEQLGRDTVEAVVWSMSETEALLLDRSMRWGERETALEEGWLLVELEQRFGYGQEELARRFNGCAVGDATMPAQPSPPGAPFSSCLFGKAA